MRTILPLVSVLLLALAAPSSPARAQEPATATTIATEGNANGPVDLQRFMGRWYVIGIIPTRLERGNHNPVETYRLDSKGQVCTWYRYRPGGFQAPVKLLASTGLVQPGTGNAEWKVRFFGLFKAQYLIGWLAPDYSQVMVVRDARDYLWYMARTPSVPDADYQAMLQRAAALGYDTTRIERVPQRWPETSQDKDTFDGACR